MLGDLMFPVLDIKFTIVSWLLRKKSRAPSTNTSIKRYFRKFDIMDNLECLKYDSIIHSATQMLILTTAITATFTVVAIGDPHNEMTGVPKRLVTRIT